MIYQSLAYWMLLAATAAVFSLSSPAAARTRSAALIGASLLTLALVAGIDLWFGVVLLMSVAWIMLAVRLAAGSHKRPVWVLYMLGPVAIVWVLSKVSSASHLGLLQFVGYSYFFIKAGTLLKDLQDRRIENPDPFVVVAYFLHFPTFISGPMHLFNEFDRSLRAPEFPDLEGLVDAVFRILLGLVKVKVLAPLLLPISLEALASSGTLSLATLGIGCIAYSIVIWANFSGYTDLAVATSRLMGVYTPENFNYPYAAANIREFWQRWHITFTRVLTSYVFVPLSRRLQTPLEGRPVTLMIVCTTVTFLFCGFWHGATSNFLVWGLYHAAGLIAYDLYRPGAMRRRLKRKGSPHAALVNRLERWSAIAGTFAFVSAGWIFFVLPISRLLGN